MRPAPVAVTLKLALPPVQPDVLAGWAVIAAGMLTVNVAQAVVTEGVQVPDTIHWYVLPLATAVTPVTV